MEVFVYWFIAAFVLLGLEMMTGTFYLLVLSIALGVGGMAALSGFHTNVQLVFSAIAAVTGIVILQVSKAGRNKSGPNQDLDIGQSVRVVKQGDGGKLRVHYRGTEWDAELESPGVTGETLYIKALRGSVLIVSPDKPA